MAEIIETQTQPTGANGALNATASPTSNQQNQPAGTKPGDGQGAQVNGLLTRAATEALREGELADLFHTPFDRDVTIQGYPDTMFNQMFRTIGFRQILSMKFDRFSIDQRKAADFVKKTGGIVIPIESTLDKKLTGGAIVSIPVADVDAFDTTDQITFKGVSGADKNGLPHKHYFLNGWVCDTDKENGVIKVVLLNAEFNVSKLNSLTDFNFPGLSREGAAAPYSNYALTIADDTEILILGHALAEEDSHVPPSASIPEPTECYMQKFMTMAAVSNVWLDSEKNVNWGLADIKESVSREFLLECEKTILLGHKSYFKDPKSGKNIRTMGGILEQLIEDGVEPLELWSGDLTDESVIKTMATIFVGNRGSERRYMATGMDFASALFSLESMVKQVNTNPNKREYTYDWNIWKLFNYTIQNKPYALFDMLGFGNVALVFDKANMERVVFRAMDEDMLDLDKLMIEDSKVLRCCEISSFVVKYAKCHRLIIMHDGKQANNPTGANDITRYAA